ncbi:MAG TPA: exodeoxyribonuclease VII small subunit [Thiobacillaceae bacterium]|nr:exodeoxyribonuclease VII small subunit [Thiobacillaceae bacterium]HNU64334.1 exodeoxyribonuclease VII small subunit [Thiobacillaceae bacterium]
MTKTNQAVQPKDFEAAIQELEQVVTDMESGRLSLEASLAAYKRGMELSAYCQKTLEEAELQVKILEKGQLQGFTAGTEGAAADD